MDLRIMRSSNQSKAISPSPTEKRSPLDSPPFAQHGVSLLNSVGCKVRIIL